MTLHNNLTLAALASDVMPSVTVCGVRDVRPSNDTDNDAGISYAVVQDSSGQLYDIYASSTGAGRERLTSRAKAARALTSNASSHGLGFLMDAFSAFKPGSTHSKGDRQAVLATPHINGECRSLNLLTLEDCASVGTAIGAIHRLNTDFISKVHYPSFTNAQIRKQLTAWVTRLQHAGHVPSAITSSWSDIIETDDIWHFSTCFTHGGFQDGDFVFTDSTINAVTNWQRMQTNDPARDLAWTFSKLDEVHRNQVLSSYGTMMGSKLDELIMIRANLWLQMEEVGEFIEAMRRGDNAQIVKFKAQVEKLAHELTVITNRKNAGADKDNEPRSGATPNSKADSSSKPNDGTFHRDADASGEYALNGQSNGSGDDSENDATDSTAVHAVTRPASLGTGYDAQTADSKPSETMSNPPAYPYMDTPSSSTTVSLPKPTAAGQIVHDPDPANDHDGPRTLLIPKHEAQQLAMDNSQEGLDEYENRKPDNPEGTNESTGSFSNASDPSQQ